MQAEATFNNISVISVLLLEYPEKITDLMQVTDKLYHKYQSVRNNNYQRQPFLLSDQVKMRNFCRGHQTNKSFVLVLSEEKVFKVSANQKQ
jgi:hypothetical protein